MPQVKLTSQFFAEVNRLRKKFPKLTKAQAYKLADENLNPKKLKLNKKPAAKPSGKLTPKGKFKPQGVMQSNRLITKSPAQPVKEDVIVEEKKGLSLYWIAVGLFAAYYFIFKKKR